MRPFATTTDLLEHQRLAVAKLLPTKVGALFMDMGTGKSRTLIELARVRAAKFDRLVWFCPVSLKATVRHEILKHTSCQPADIYMFPQDVPDSVPSDASWYIIGIESMSASDKAYLAALNVITEQSFVVVDESIYIKGWRAKRSRRITRMASLAKYRAIMTGTPFTQGAADLFAQLFFLSPKILGYSSFYSFAKNHIEYETIKVGGQHIRTGRILRCHDELVLARKMAPYVYQVRKEECLDLPEKLYETRYFEMSAAQASAYQQAKDFMAEQIMLADIGDNTPILALFTKLQSITCGFWTPPYDGERQTLEHGRVDLLMTVLEEIPAGEKVIIWAKYRHAVDEIADALDSDSVAFFHGGISPAQREADVMRWRTDPACRYLVATQAAGGHGLTLNEAAYSVFYADSFKFSERIQAEDRNHRIGQMRRPVYITLQCEDSIDARVSGALAKKQNALELFRQQIDHCKAHGLRDKAMELINSL